MGRLQTEPEGQNALCFWEKSGLAFLDQAEEPCFSSCPMGTCSGPNIWPGVARLGSPAPSPVSPRHKSMTAGSDDCTMCPPVEFVKDGKSGTGLERGLMEPDFSAYMGTKHAGGGSFGFGEAKPGSASTMGSRDEGKV